MKKIINEAPIVRYRASVSEVIFPDFWNQTFSAESLSRHDPEYDKINKMKSDTGPDTGPTDPGSMVNLRRGASISFTI